MGVAVVVVPAQKFYQWSTSTGSGGNDFTHIDTYLRELKMDLDRDGVPRQNRRIMLMVKGVPLCKLVERGSAGEGYIYIYMCVCVCIYIYAYMYVCVYRLLQVSVYL